MKLAIIGRGKLSWLAEEILTGYEIEFFDDMHPELQNTEASLHEKVFISIGHNQVRKQLFSIYHNREIISVVSKNAVVSKLALIGKGAFVNNFCSIHAHAKLGLGCLVHPNTVIDVGATIGDFCRFGSQVHIAENVSIGDGCIVGSGVVVLPNVSIGSNCEVCAGAVVTRSFGDNETIAGSPARSVKVS